METTTNLKEIETTILNKIDAGFNKMNDEKATKEDVADLSKQFLNLKATLAVKGEDPDDAIKKFNHKSVWTKGLKAAWVKELAHSFEAENAWRKASNPKEFRKSFLEKANLNEIDSTQGLGMLPVGVDSVIQKLIPLSGVARSSCRVLPGIHGSVNINKVSTYPSFGFTVTTNVNRDDSTVTPDNGTRAYVNLQPLQASGIAKITEKLLYDAVPGVLEDVAENLAINAALFEDTCLFTGDGTATYGNFTGLKTATIGYNNVTVGARTGSFTNFDPILQCRSAVHPSVVNSPNFAWHMTPQTFGLLTTFKASTSGIYFYDISQGMWNIAGSPIKFNQVMDSPDTVNGTTFSIAKVPVIAGDLSKAVTMGIGRDTQLKTLLELYAATNEIGIRLTYDFNFALVLGAAVTRVVIVS